MRFMAQTGSGMLLFCYFLRRYSTHFPSYLTISAKTLRTMACYS
ncbi:hypothetical protein BN137_2589 [Cronobacter condimenti 1330]|uniref:Uncharacterized protein n=1 Tax=Cronobacter condimenti 1330 TaxID=1073999 RepID=K8A178_9ENTR|nr:hypothetical protein BN137_2589 [Cronobacter condimenti 1330]